MFSVSRLVMIVLVFRRLLSDFPAFSTCREGDLHGPLAMTKNLELRQGHFARHPHRVGPLVPFVPDVPHGVADCAQRIHK